MFDYPNISALAGFLASKVTLSGPPVEASLHGEAGSLGWLSDEDGSLCQELLAADSAPPLCLVGASELVVRSAGDAMLSPATSDQSRPIPVERWDVEAQADLAGGVAVQVTARAADRVRLERS